MRALVFGVPPQPLDGPDDALTHSPVALRHVADPQLLHDDWVITRPRLTGICGSDSKQILLDFGEGDADNAMAAFCSFPQIMGHEVVADVVQLGPKARGLEVGQRVVLNPWLSCGPRGIEPPCPACQSGDYSLCWSFCDGDIKPGIHTGVSADVTGGYAELMPAHDSMLFAVPESVPDELAVFADPFSVSLHAITRHPPPRSGRVLVYGAGSLGLCAVAILRALYPDVAVAVVARFDAQAELARRFGAAVVLAHEPRLAVIEELVNWGGGRLWQPLQGLPMAHPGCRRRGLRHRRKARDVRSGSAGAGLAGDAGEGRRACARPLGVEPAVFQRDRLVGSNAFGVEEVDGQRKHAIEHYLDLVIDGRIDLRPMLTHTFGLDQWRDAFLAIANQGDSGAVKVAFDQR